MAQQADRAGLIDMITGCWKTQVIGQGVAFGLFDGLAGGPQTASALAGAASINAGGAMRLLRALAVLGLVEHLPGDRFALTPTGALLCRDVPDSLNGMAGHWGERIWDGFGRLGTSVRTGEASIPSGPEHFAVMQADPAAADIFNRAMAEGSLRVGRALASVYDFSGFSRLMDVGGGYGALLVGPLEANPALAGQVYDLPALAEPARTWLGEQGIGDRVDYLGGSFFETVPPGADCILVKFILHDWNDARCETILNHCRAAADGGTILIIERIVPETVSPADTDVVRGDLVMLGVGGKERTEAEYHALLGQAGLRISRIVNIDGNFSAIEAQTV
ncbi:MAG TPA: methyltransferase [Sphingobium sp.]